MAVLEDPSRMYVGTIPKFGAKIAGMRIDDLCAKYNAAGGMNGGGFEDAGGAGKAASRSVWLSVRVRSCVSTRRTAKPPASSSALMKTTSSSSANTNPTKLRV